MGGYAEVLRILGGGGGLGGLGRKIEGLRGRLEED